MRVGGWRLVAVGGGWQLAAGGWWSLGAVLNNKKIQASYGAPPCRAQDSVPTSTDSRVLLTRSACAGANQSGRASMARRARSAGVAP